jgi:tetratricopeptide (TPR) repeat protein
LYGANPASSAHGRDLTVGLVKIGDVLRDRNDAEGALTHYREALETARAVYDADRNNAQNARDLIASLQRRGSALHRRGDTASARRDLTEALSIAEQLNATGSGNATHALAVERLRAMLAQLPQKSRRNAKFVTHGGQP